MGELPPVEETPRISNSRHAGSARAHDTPGTDCIRLLKSVSPRSWMSAPDTAVKLIARVLHGAFTLLRGDDDLLELPGVGMRLLSDCDLSERPADERQASGGGALDSILRH